MSNLQGEGKRKLDPAGEMPLIEHLDEIRKRLIRALLAVFVFSVVGFYFAEHIFKFLSAPLIEILPEYQDKMIYTSLPEVFFVYIKVGIFAGIICSAPILFYQLWKFVSPALYPDERSGVVAFVLVSTLFFLAGASFCYYQIFPWGFQFFIGFTSDSITPMITLKEYLKFTTRLILVFGLVFEMPILSAFLARIGLVTPKLLRKNRHYAIILIFMLAAFLTPPDVVTQLMLATPMMVLYEISIVAAIIFGRKRRENESD